MSKVDTYVRANILKLQAYSSARNEYSCKQGVFLDANENPYGIYNRYPDPNQSEIKNVLASRNDVDISNIFIGNGSDEVIDLAFRVFCDPGIDKAVVFFPSYGMYTVSASINNISLISIPLKDNFCIDIQDVSPYFDNPSVKLCIICSPNNPTGNVENYATIETIIQNFKGIVIIDEAYIQFSQTSSWNCQVNEYHNLIVCQTLSKAYGLAAARIGIAYSNTEIIQIYNKVKPPYNVSLPNQKIALQCIQDENTYKRNRQNIIKERIRMNRALKNIKCIQKVYPSEANFILVQVDCANSIYQKLISNNIIVRNRHSQIENCLRLTIGTYEENNILLQVLMTI